MTTTIQVLAIFQTFVFSATQRAVLQYEHRNGNEIILLFFVYLTYELDSRV